MASASIRQYDKAKDQLNFAYAYNLEETTALHAFANRNAMVDIGLLRRISLWKLNRILEIPESTIQRLQALATSDAISLDSPNVRSLINELIGCPGVGLPMASTILKFLRPDIFPIIDVRAYRALNGKKVSLQSKSESQLIEIYVKYSADIRGLAEKLNRPLREIDEQLYCFDKTHNGKI